jgi:hypothetical protein
MMTPQERDAWELYCEETSGDMDVRDYWCDLPEPVQKMYLEKAKKARDYWNDLPEAARKTYLETLRKPNRA